MSLSKMSFSSWREKDFGNFLEYVLEQENDVCWAIAIIRQMIALYKLEGLEEHCPLSIQYLIDAVPRRYMNNKGGLTRLDDVVNVLTKEGTVLDEICPLTYFVDVIDKHMLGVPRFRVNSVTIKTPSDFISQEMFELEILHNLKSGPITASMPNFESYSSLYGLATVYAPRESEIKDFFSGVKVLGFHSMLLTGNGVDENGVEFWEFQETKGIRWGINGYIKIARSLGLLLNFIVLQLGAYHSDMDIDDLDHSDMDMDI